MMKTHDRLIAALRSGNSDEQRPACPDETALAMYVDGSLAGESRDALEQHLAWCGACRSQVAAAMRIAAALTTPHSSGLPLGSFTRSPLRTIPRRRRGLAATTLAAAAVLVMGLGVLLLLPGAVSVEQDGTRQTRQSRLVPTEAIRPQILAPVEHASVHADGLSVRWNAMARAAAYRVWILDQDGDVVLEARVVGTIWNARPSLVPGHYYVRVDALIDEAKPLSSHHVPFTVEEAN